MHKYRSTYKLISCKSEAREQGEQVNQILYGEELELVEKSKKWVKIKTLHDDYEGFIDRKIFDDLKQIEQDEDVSPLLAHDFSMPNQPGNINLLFGSMVGDIDGARRGILEKTELLNITNSWIGAPYMWGGRSVYGVDCSGFTQLVMRALGTNLQRDASQQVKQGDLIEALEDVQTGDLAFFHNEKGNVTHVGIITNVGEYTSIVHASGKVRSDYLVGEGIYNMDLHEITHKFHSVRRYF